ncbi:MAG: hypothetical protein E7643_04360 [Ruminococcaceae bacterium]|nr:hypothetical protein [Oscillospiraceae bacterium]
MADYLYGSARVRSLENAIVGRDRILRIAQSKSVVEAYSVLGEAGVELLRDENGNFLREETLLGILKNAYRTVISLAPDSTALRLWLYPYDCNNLKAAIKAFIRGIDPASMMFDFGTKDARQIVEMVEKSSFAGLSPMLARAASEAVEAYSKTKNPQKIDLILDRACYGDMLRAAQGTGNDFVLRLVRAKIDLLNVSMTLRVLRMQSGEAGRGLLDEALLSGGALDTEELGRIYSKGEDALWAFVARSDYARLADMFSASEGTTADVDRLADDFWMDMIRETKFIPVGLEVMVSFLLAHEYEVKNLRIVLSGKEAGLPVKTICERIRESYV